MCDLLQEKNDELLPDCSKNEGTWFKVRRTKKRSLPATSPNSVKPAKSVKTPKSVNHVNANHDSKLIVEHGSKLCYFLPHNSVPGLYIETKIENCRKHNSRKTDAQKPKADEVNQRKGDDSFNEKTLDPAKKLRNLKKRLREIQTLEQKIYSGELKKPQTDQLAKVGRKQELIGEIEDLEASLEC